MLESLMLPNTKRLIGGLKTKGIYKSSYENKPLVSIITVVYNGEKHIEDTIRSLLSQTYDNIEYIIIDGGSTDNTLKIIQKYEDHIDYFISEKDNGIANAWNKGIALAKGELIGLLNADDMYASNTIEIVATEFRQERSSERLYYGVCKFVENGFLLGINQKQFLSSRLIYGFGFTHTTCFVPLEIYQKIGYFNENIKIAIDSDFLLRCYQKGIVFQQLSYSVYMRRGGVSDQHSQRAYFEYLDLLYFYKLISKVQVRIYKVLYAFYSILRPIVKSILLRNILRQCKHSMVKGMNMIYNYIPTFYLKNGFLSFLRIVIGRNSYIHSPVLLYRYANLIIGNNTVINHSCYLDNRAKILIGNNVSIAHNVKIYTCGHDVQTPFFDLLCKDVIIEDYVVIFANVLIMPGVTISQGSVLYPGCVVTKNTEPYGIYGGVPARLIGKRNNLLCYTLDYGFWGAL